VIPTPDFAYGKFKLGALSGSQIRRHQYEDTFCLEPTTGPERLKIGARQPLQILLQLYWSISEPLHLLYVLHTSRCGSKLGRYESPAVDRNAINQFTGEFYEFLTEDARHDLWILSPQSSATLVLDRHDLIYAYGPLSEFQSILQSNEIQEGEVSIPVPHSHHYHHEWDSAELKVLSQFPWRFSPLLPQDQQC